MNKSELVDEVSKDTATSKAIVGPIVDSLIGQIIKNLPSQKSITIAGFGSFALSERRERTGRNPQTGATITIPASTTVKFKSSKALKERFN